MTNWLDTVYIEIKNDLSWSIERVRSMIKTRWDNNMTGRMGLLYARKEIVLPWSIKLGTVYDKNQIGKWRDWSYSYGLQRKWSWVVMTNRDQM